MAHISPKKVLSGFESNGIGFASLGKVSILRMLSWGVRAVRVGALA
jgi:hypothetical protein